MVAKRFFYVCAGLLCLALAYHFGAVSATAQAPGNPIVGVDNQLVVTANGDVYVPDPAYSGALTYWILAGNVFSSGPTPARVETWGSMKARYRGERGAAQPEGRQP